MPAIELPALMAIISIGMSAALLLPQVQSRGVGVAPSSSMPDISCLHGSGPSHTPIGSLFESSMDAAHG